VIGVAIYSVQAELAINEAMVILWPIDPIAAFDAKLARAYRRARLALLALAAVLMVAGVLLQPLGSAVIALGLMMIAAERRAQPATVP
jgi:hypothetical protein